MTEPSGKTVVRGQVVPMRRVCECKAMMHIDTVFKGGQQVQKYFCSECVRIENP